MYDGVENSVTLLLLDTRGIINRDIDQQSPYSIIQWFVLRLAIAACTCPDMGRPCQFQRTASLKVRLYALRICPRFTSQLAFMLWVPEQLRLW